MFEKNTIADFERTTFKTAGCFKIMRTLNTISEKMTPEFPLGTTYPREVKSESKFRLFSREILL